LSEGISGEDWLHNCLLICRLLVCYVLADNRDMHPSVSYCNLREMLTAKCAGLTI